MSVAQYAAYSAAAGAPLGVTQGAPGAYGGGHVTTVQAPPVVMPAQVTSYTTAGPATTAVPAAPYGAAGMYANAAAAGLGAATYAMPGAGLFDALDRNHDGVITRAEFNTAVMPQAMGAGQVDFGPAGPPQAFAAPFPGAGAAIPGFENMGNPLPPPPKRLCEGLPDPRQVEQQKVQYARALDGQLAAGKKTIEEQTQQAKAILLQQAEEKKMQYAMHIDQQLMEQEMSLDQQTHSQVMQLHQAAFQQKSQLEQQASNLTLEYKQREMQEALEQKKYDLQLRQCAMREQMHTDYTNKTYFGGGAGVASQPGPSPAEPVQQDPYAGKPPLAPPYPGASPAAGGGGAPATQIISQPGPQQQQQPPQLPQQMGTPVSSQQYEQPGMSPMQDPGYGSAQYAPQQPQYSSAQYGSAQYSSANFGQPGGTPTAGYAPPPTQYAAPPTSCGAPPTACGVPPTMMAGGVVPQTSINSLGGMSPGPCGH